MAIYQLWMLVASKTSLLALLDVKTWFYVFKTFVYVSAGLGLRDGVLQSHSNNSFIPQGLKVAVL